MKWESRRAPRKPISLSIRVRVNPAMKETLQLAKESIEVQMVDISTIGAGFLSKTYLPADALVDFDLPESSLSTELKPPAQGVLRLTGRIVYARPQGGLCRMGLEFTQIDEKGRLLIERYNSAG